MSAAAARYPIWWSVTGLIELSERHSQPEMNRVRRLDCRGRSEIRATHHALFDLVVAREEIVRIEENVDARASDEKPLLRAKVEGPCEGVSAAGVRIRLDAF